MQLCGYQVAARMRSPMQDTDQDISFLGYIRVLRRRAWIIAAITLIFIWGGVAYAFRQTPVYRSSMKIVIAIPLDTVNSTTVQQETESEAVLLKGGTLAEGVIRSLTLHMSQTQLLSRLLVV